MPDDSEGVERIGLEAYMGTTAFDKGMRKYLEGIGVMETKTDQAAKTMGGSGGAGGGGLTGAAIMAAAALGTGGLGTVVMGLASAFGGPLVSGMRQAYNMFKQYLDLNAGVQLAARVQELDYVVQIMGQNAGLTNEQLQEQIKAITTLGIRQDEARNSVIQFMQAQLDLSKAGQLARAAQDLAVVGALDSSDAYQRLIYAITRTDTLMLRTIGINVQADQVYDRYASTINKTAGALTSAERQQAFLNAVLDESTKYAGAYEASMTSASKQLRSLTGRELPELMMSLGQPLLNAFFNIIKGTRELVQGFQALIQEGGPLRDVLITIGGAADLLTEPFLNAAKAFKSAMVEFAESGTGPVRDMIDWFQEKFGGLAQQALDWGANLIESFAEGMVQGIVAVINVLAHLGEVIAGWLMPGSPPKILPDLDEWGAETMQVYMDGWKKADFSVFSDISNTIKGYLTSLAGNKAEDRGAVVRSVLGSREAITAAQNQMRETGKVTEEAINGIIQAAGIGTQSFRQYIEAMLNSELAAKKVKDIQDEMVTTAKKWDDQLAALNAELNALTEGSGEQERLADINEAISTGLLTAEEQARLEAEKRTIELRQQIRSVEDQRDAEMNALNDKLTAAQQEQDLNQQNLETAKAMLDVQQEQNNLLKEYLQAQEQALKEAKMAAGKGAGAGAGLGDIGASIGSGLGEGIQDALRTSIENAKNMIRERLKTMWEDFKKDFKSRFPELFESWENLKTQWGPVFDSLKKWWAEDVVPAWKIAVEYWNSDLGPALDGLWTWFVTKGIPAVEDFYMKQIDMVDLGFRLIKKVWEEELRPALTEFSTWIVETGAPAVVDIKDKTVAWLTDGWTALHTFWIQNIQPMFREINRFIKEDLNPTIIKITELFVTFRETGLRLLHQLWKETIQPMLRDFWDWFENKIYPAVRPVVDALRELKDSIFKGIADLWKTELKPAMLDIKTKFSDAMGPAGKFRDILNDLKTGIYWAKVWLKELRDQIDSWIASLGKMELPWWLQRHSPSPFEQALMGASKLMKEMNASVIPEFNRKLVGLNGATLHNDMFSGNGATVNNYYNRTTNLTMNPQYSTVKSPSSVYWDASAALAASRI